MSKARGPFFIMSKFKTTKTARVNGKNFQYYILPFHKFLKAIFFFGLVNFCL